MGLKQLVIFKGNQDIFITNDKKQLTHQKIKETDADEIITH